MLIAKDISIVNYRYRDASNYKYWGSFALWGKFDASEIDKFLCWSEFFIPEKIGVVSLVPLNENDDDHLMHTIEEVEYTSGYEALCTSDDFIERFRLAHENGWFDADLAETILKK